MSNAYLVFFSRDPVDDDLAGVIAVRVRAVAGAGWFDDPGAGRPEERTCGGYVRVAAPDVPDARALLDAAQALSAEHGLHLEVQWREEPIGHLVAGTWREA